MPYTKHTWTAGSAGATPESAPHLNDLEAGLEAAYALAEAGGGGGGEGGVIEWASVLNKPTTFPPEAHTHAPDQITSGYMSMGRYQFTGHAAYYSANGNTAYTNGTHHVTGDMQVDGDIIFPAPTVDHCAFFNSTTDNLGSTTPSSKNATTTLRLGNRSVVRLDMFWSRAAAAGSWTKILEIPSTAPAPPAAVEVYIINTGTVTVTDTQDVNNPSDDVTYVTGAPPARIKINTGSREVFTQSAAGTFNGQIVYFA